MKIRQGFVSNSSSASFIVTINIPKFEFLSLLNNEFGWNYFSKSAFIGILKVDINDQQESIDNDKKEIEEIILERKEKPLLEGELDRLYWRQKFIADWEESIKQRKEILEKIEKYNISDHKYNGEEDFLCLVEDVLAYHGVCLKSILNDVWEISAWTAMFNSYENMPELLKEIMLMFAFNNRAMNCKVIED